MADPIAVQVKRAHAELRLAAAARAAGEAFGVALGRSILPANRYPELAAAENLEHVAQFLEDITAKQKAKKP